MSCETTPVHGVEVGRLGCKKLNRVTLLRVLAS